MGGGVVYCGVLLVRVLWERFDCVILLHCSLCILFGCLLSLLSAFL